jgi:uncharacterized protein YaeQ
MALGATIYKTDLHVSDTDRHYYGTHALTIARHPSETLERMMARVLAFSIHANEYLAFTKGISEADEPDIWLKDLTGAIDLWVEVGQPTETRLLKACGRAGEVVVYCHHGQASRVWWDGASPNLQRARNLSVIALPIEPIRTLATKVTRNMALYVNIQERELFISTDDDQISLTPEVWRESRE